jgi:hypothetical protein
MQFTFDLGKQEWADALRQASPQSCRASWIRARVGSETLPSFALSLRRV